CMPLAVARPVGSAACGGCPTTRDLDRAGQAVLVRPHGKDDALGMSCGDLDDAFAGGGDLERHLRHVGCRKPFETARRAVAIDLVAAEVGLQALDVALELVDRHRPSADLPE